MNLQGRLRTRGIALDLVRPLGQIADPQIRGEMDEDAIRPGIDSSNLQMRGNRTTTIFAIGKMSKSDVGFTDSFFRVPGLMWFWNPDTPQMLGIDICPRGIQGIMNPLCQGLIILLLPAIVIVH